MNDTTAATLLGIVLGFLIGAIVVIPLTVWDTNNEIEKKCLYGERLVFSTDKVFECKYMEGVKVK